MQQPKRKKFPKKPTRKNSQVFSFSLVAKYTSIAFNLGLDDDQLEVGTTAISGVLKIGQMVVGSANGGKTFKMI